MEMTDVRLDLDVVGIPVEFEYDRASGEVTAYNDELRVMAIGRTPPEAEASFRSAVVALLVEAIATGSPVPASLRRVEPRSAEQPPSPNRELASV